MKKALIVVMSLSACLSFGQVLPEHIPGEVLVKFKPGTQLVAMLENNRLKARVAETIPNINVSRIILSDGMSVEDAIKHYSSLPFVEFAEANLIMRTAYTPNDPYFGPYQWGPKQIACESAWNYSWGSSSVRISIVDTGISTSHPDLTSKVVAGYNFVNNNSNWNDGNGHGSHCAGIAAAITNNGVGIAGVGFNCRLMAAKVLNNSGSGTISAIANGINWSVNNGAKVVSLSLGASSGSSTLSNAVNYAWNNNVLPVAASGNNGSTSVFYPAGYTNCMAVGASTTTDGKASFSNYGTWVDVAAPGVNIASTYKGSGYVYMNGTSMACPHVSGVAGLVWSYYGTGQTASFVRNRIQNNCDNVGGWVSNGWCKYGRVNALKALIG